MNHVIPAAKQPIEASPALIEMRPHHADGLLTGRLSALGITPETRWGEDGERYIARQVVPHLKAGVTADQIGEAIALAERACARMPESRLGAELARLRSLTVLPGSARESDDEARVRTAALAEELRGYPADCVRTALRQPWKYHPSWGELHAALEPLARWRMLLLGSLRRLDVQALTHQPAPEPEISQEQRDALVAMARELTANLRAG